MITSGTSNERYFKKLSIQFKCSKKQPATTEYSYFQPKFNAEKPPKTLAIFSLGEALTISSTRSKKNLVSKKIEDFQSSFYIFLLYVDM